MSITPQRIIKEKYFRKEMFPTIFCSGCGIGATMNYTARAIDNLGIDLKDVVLVSGIGCSSRIPSYFNANALHATHGRALAFATGIKLVKPKLKVIVFSGDGDCVSIGGNHFLHTIRRNIDLTLIISNNYAYGMTGGQLAPTTPTDSITTTSPYGAVEHPIDISRTAKVLGASYVARWTAAHPLQAIKSIEKAISKNGLSLVEILSQAPVCYGKLNKLANPIKLMRWYLENTVMYDDKEGKKSISEYMKEMEDEMVIGEFVDRERESFMDSYRRMVERIKNEKGG